MEALLAFGLRLLRNLVANVGLLILFGAYLGLSQLVKLRAARRGLDADALADVTFWVGIGAVVGGRLAHLAPSLSVYVSNPLDLLLINTGMNLYGALGGGLLVGVLLTRRRALPLGEVADLYGLYLPLAIAAVRFSCLIDNSCYGRQAPAPLGILFPGLTQPRLPSDLYEGFLTLLLFAGLLWLSERHARRGGTLFLGFLIGYPLIRAAVDMTRISVGGMVQTVDPLLSIGLAAAAGALTWHLARQPVRDSGDSLDERAIPVDPGRERGSGRAKRRSRR
ncbi:MAG: prolipoprotein diacylglyceryl transferase [Chloroflexi bacterium]|nr:prolipoprotein diacylglyceryl transferase [Chloroflexota bacterium]